MSAVDRFRARTRPPQGRTVPLASFGQRAAAAVADLSLFGIASVLLRVAVVLPLAMSELATLEGFDLTGEGDPDLLHQAVQQATAAAAARVAGVYLVLAIISHLAYFALQERRPTGRTLGKRLPGIAVVDAATLGPISTRQALLRAAGKLLSGLPLALGFGYLWMLFDRHNRTWHDLLAGTLVVRRKTPPPPPPPSPPPTG